MKNGVFARRRQKMIKEGYRENSRSCAGMVAVPCGEENAFHRVADRRSFCGNLVSRKRVGLLKSVTWTVQRLEATDVGTSARRSGIGVKRCLLPMVGGILISLNGRSYKIFGSYGGCSKNMGRLLYIGPWTCRLSGSYL